MPSSSNEPVSAKPGFSGSQVGLIVLAVVLITAAITFYLVRVYVFPSELEPVTLSVKEETVLNQKLEQLGWQPSNRSRLENDSGGPVSAKPERYTEVGASREVRLSEKELNSMIGGSPEFGRRVAIDISDDLASAVVLISVPPDFPVMPGQLIRVNAGLELRLDSTRRPVVALRGVSIMGVPIPNAWLGNLKNINLVKEFGHQGFWKSFADGVEDIRLTDGALLIKLRE